MNNACSKCHHIMPEGAENHVCPSAEYTTARNRMVHLAAMADEFYSEDELEGAAMEIQESQRSQLKEIATEIRECAQVVVDELKKEPVKLMLAHYLKPNGKYPYENLAPKMEQLHAEGRKVHLTSVPGFLMGTNHPAATGDPWIWSNLSGTFYKTAADLLADKNGFTLM